MTRACHTSGKVGHFLRACGDTRIATTPDRKSTRLNSSHTEIYTLSLHDALPIFTCTLIDHGNDASLPHFGQSGAFLACLRRHAHRYHAIFRRAVDHLPFRVGLGRDDEVTVGTGTGQTTQYLC